MGGRLLCRGMLWVCGGFYAIARRVGGGWALAYGAMGFGLITTLTATAPPQPHRQVYFDALADAKTPGALAKRYDMDRLPAA